MNWLSNRRRRAAIRKYAARLGRELVTHYGASEYYTASQIAKAVEHARLPLAYIRYGYAMYLSEADFDAVPMQSARPGDYEALRQEVADLCFSGNKKFSPKQAVAAGEAAGGLDIGWWGTDGSHHHHGDIGGSFC